MKSVHPLLWKVRETTIAVETILATLQISTQKRLENMQGKEKTYCCEFLVLYQPANLTGYIVSISPRF